MPILQNKLNVQRHLLKYFLVFVLLCFTSPNIKGQKFKGNDTNFIEGVRFPNAGIGTFILNLSSLNNALKKNNFPKFNNYGYLQNLSVDLLVNNARASYNFELFIVNFYNLQQIRAKNTFASLTGYNVFASKDIPIVNSTRWYLSGNIGLGWGFYNLYLRNINSTSLQFNRLSNNPPNSLKLVYTSSKYGIIDGMFKGELSLEYIINWPKKNIFIDHLSLSFEAGYMAAIPVKRNWHLSYRTHISPISDLPQIPLRGFYLFPSLNLNIR